MFPFTPVSLVIPVYNESTSIDALIATIKSQVFHPAEVILVDGGSTDDTVKLATQLFGNDTRYRIIEAGRAMPGKGRNIGAENAKYNWIAFTDAGIKLDTKWLENMVLKAEANPEAAIIYGNFSPQLNSLYEKAAAVAYVPALQPKKIRTKSIASCLLKKEVWEKIGGFPDWRAAEDLVFIEKAEEMGFPTVYASEAMVYWQLQPNFSSTYRKFKLYSTYNVWAGRQAFWHYGVARQYAVMVGFTLLGIFYSWYWLLLIPVWLIARTTKRVLAHKFEFGLKQLFSPAFFLLVILITVVIDTATFSGWIAAIRNKRPFA